MMSELAHQRVGIDIHPGPPSAARSSSTTAPGVVSVRPRSSAIGCASTRASPWAP
jgi:hypothetical protein